MLYLRLFLRLYLRLYSRLYLRLCSYIHNGTGPAERQRHLSQYLYFFTSKASKLSSRLRLEQDPCGKSKRIMQLVGVEDFGLPQQVISTRKSQISGTKVLQKASASCSSSVGVEDFGLPQQVISGTKVLQNLTLVVLKYYKKQARHAASWRRRFQKREKENCPSRCDSML